MQFSNSTVIMAHLPSGSKSQEIILYHIYLYIPLVSEVTTSSSSGDILTVLARIIEPFSMTGSDTVRSTAKL